MAMQINNPKGEHVIDPYRSIQIYHNGLNDKLARFSEHDRTLVGNYIADMEKGKNINGRKGKRGYMHLNTLLSRLVKIAEIAEEKYGKKLTELTADDLHDLFDAMRDGKIKKTRGGGRYKATHDYIKIFKAFWHWYMRIQRQHNKVIKDITIDLSGSAEHKPDFVYFTLSSLRFMMDHAKYDFRVLMLFMFDSGIRITEMLNLKRKDITPVPNSNKFYLNIREETSKTFGRKIKLMLCNDLLKQYLEQGNFQNNDFIFVIDPRMANRYLKRLSERIFGKKLENLKENTSNKPYITLYDFRHSSCCYWLPRYQSESALKWRFGWKTSDMIYYYSEFLGMKDTIQEEDMLVDTTKTEIENQLEKERNARELLEEQMNVRFRQLDKINVVFDEVIKYPAVKKIVAEVVRKKIREGALKA